MEKWPLENVLMGSFGPLPDRPGSNAAYEVFVKWFKMSLYMSSQPAWITGVLYGVVKFLDL